MSGQMQWKDFEEHCKQIERATSVDTTEKAADRHKRIAINKQKYRAFFEYYFPQYAKARCSWFHILIAHLLLRNRTFKAVMEWFRGSAKSTHATLGYPLWLMVNGELKTMLLVGQTEKKAFRLLADIQANLTHNRRFINDFGEQFSFGNWSEGEFITKQGIAFYAIGIGQNPRGTRNEANRPDYIVVDDADSKKLSKNPQLVREAYDWIMEDLMGCFDIGAERFLLVNNRIAKTAILATCVEEKFKGAYRHTLKQLSLILKSEGIEHSTDFTRQTGGIEYQSVGNWHHLKVNAIDKGGNPTWPEKYTRQYWQEKKAETSLRAWEKEYMNNPVEEGTTFKYDWIKWKQALPWKQYERLVAYCDPSFKNTATSDFKAIKVWGKIGTELHLIKAFVRQCSVGTMVKWFYDLHESIPKDVICDYYMEANFLQDLIMDEFSYEGNARGYQLPIRGDKRAKPDKFSRIEATSPLYERGFVHYNLEEKDNPDMQKGIEQLLAIEQGSKVPDDSPDADEGAIWMLQQTTRQKHTQTRIGRRVHKQGY